MYNSSTNITHRTTLSATFKTICNALTQLISYAIRSGARHLPTSHTLCHADIAQILSALCKFCMSDEIDADFDILGAQLLAVGADTSVNANDDALPRADPVSVDIARPALDVALRKSTVVPMRKGWLKRNSARTPSEHRRPILH